MTNLATLKANIVLLGCGRMGLAMLRGWLKAGLSPERLLVIEPRPTRELRQLAREHGFALAETAPPSGERLRNTNVLVAAVKPQVLTDALAPLVAELGDARPLVLSIMAGKPIAAFRKLLGEVPVVRAMPNTPAAIGHGITGMVAGADASPEQVSLARALLAVLGDVVVVDNEDDIDSITAISGSGPAYAFLFVECLAQAARELGLPADTAERLARRTMTGAAALLERDDETPAALRQAVTSPGGTTEAALRVLMNEGEGLCALLADAARAARKRARELARDD